MDLQKRVYEILNVADFGDDSSRAFDVFIMGLIVANVVGVVLESVDAIYSAYGRYLTILKTFSIGVFTIEFALRVWACTEHPSGLYRHSVRGRLRYLLSPLMIADFLAILPFYVYPSLPVDLRVLRLFRLLEILRVTHYSRPLQILAVVTKRERKTLLALFTIMACLLLISSTFIYYLEHEAQPEAFASIPHALWWGMATLTTVGYGDVVPVTAIGKLFGILLMFIGIGTVAIPTGILVSAFAQEIKRKDFVATWNLVAQVPTFSRLSVQEIASITDLLKLRAAMPGEAIIRKDEVGDAMYFIVAGEVEVEIPQKPRRLRSGDFFGELALLYRTRRTTNVVALSFVELLELDAADLETLLESNQQLRDSITQEAEERRGNVLADRR